MAGEKQPAWPRFLMPVVAKAPVAERRGRDVGRTQGPNTLKGSAGIPCLVFFCSNAASFAIHPH